MGLNCFHGTVDGEDQNGAEPPRKATMTRGNQYQEISQEEGFDEECDWLEVNILTLPLLLLHIYTYVHLYVFFKKFKLTAC